MTYDHIVKGIFIDRPNRFIAHVEAGGKTVVCHVKNTGRCRELLLPGSVVILEHHPNASAKGRKTEYDLIAVYKGDLLINMDSQAPNQAALEWLNALQDKNSLILSPDPCDGERRPAAPQEIRREVTHGDSRFDLAFDLAIQGSGEKRRAFMEVKGVTLEENGMAMFPDAPTERGVKHLRGLIRARGEGFEAYVLFVIQMKRMRGFTPNDGTHLAFGQALREAAEAGVHILAFDCVVTPSSMKVDAPVPVIL